MKKIEKFVANDGKVFNNEKDCLEYEKLCEKSKKQSNKIFNDLQELIDAAKDFTKTDSDYWPWETIKPIAIPTLTIHDTGYNDPCAMCMNNPKNNPLASGVCHCVLGNRVVY